MPSNETRLIRKNQGTPAMGYQNLVSLFLSTNERFLGAAKVVQEAL